MYITYIASALCVRGPVCWSNCHLGRLIVVLMRHIPTTSGNSCRTMFVSNHAVIHICDTLLCWKNFTPRNFTLVLLTARNQFIFCKSPEEACEGAHAIIVLTEWDEFKTYDYKWLEKETGCVVYGSKGDKKTTKRNTHLNRNWLGMFYYMIGDVWGCVGIIVYYIIYCMYMHVHVLEPCSSCTFVSI